MFPLIEKEQVARAFSRAALTYDKAAIFQYEAGKRLLERLDYIKLKPVTILDLGAGTGYLSQALSTRYPLAQILLCDIARGMLDQARHVYGKRYPVWRFVCADAEALPFPNQSIDFIFSNLMLQWCNDITLVMKEWQRVLKPDGVILFSTLGPDTLTEIAQSWRQIDDQVHTLSFTDMHDIGDQLLMTGLQNPVVESEHICIYYQTVQKILQDLRDLGIRNLMKTRSKGLTSRKRFKAFIQSYEDFRDELGFLPVTFEVIYGCAKQNALLL